MEYECTLAGVDKTIFTKDGFLMPLCNDCQAKDCTNQIEYTDLSFFGRITKCRVFRRSGNYYFVVKCPGYLPENKEDNEEEEEDGTQNNTD